jgi:hypothetical protein
VNVKLYVNRYLSFYKLLYFNLNIILTYLRGLEVAELKEEIMPMVYQSLTSLNKEFKDNV